MRGSRFSFLVYMAISVLHCSAFCGTSRAQSDEDPDTLNEQVRELAEEGRWAEALASAERLVPLTLKVYGAYSDWHAAALNNVASNNQELGRYTTAESYYLRAIEISDKLSKGKSVHLAMSLDNLGNLYREMGRYLDAEPLYLRSIAILERHRRNEPEALATALTGLGLVYGDQGRYPEAEQLHRSALVLEEKAANAASIAVVQNNLATTLEKEGRKEEAEALYLRALKTTRAALGDEHPAMATRYNNLADFYRKAGRLKDAETILKKAIAVAEASLGPEHPRVALTGSSLAKVYADQKRFPEAEELYKRAITATEAAWGPDHPQNSACLYNLATLYVAQGRTKEAEPLLQRALKLKEAAGVEDDRELAMNLELLADVNYAQQRWEPGLEFARRAARLVQTRAARNAATAGAATRDNPRTELTSGTGAFVRVLEGTWQVAQQKPAEQTPLSEEAFQAQQWSTETAAATALAMLAAREGSGNPQLAALARQREDLAEQRRGVDTTLVLASAAADQMPQREKDALRRQLAELDKKVVSLDAAISKDFPSYSALTRPSAISTDEVRALIHPNEAVVQFSRVSDAIYAWIITKDRVDWKLVRDKAADLDKRMSVFLCGLDDSWWLDDKELCKASVTAQYSASDAKAGRPLPFDLGNAYAIYQTLFGQLETGTKNPDGTWRHLIIIPDAFPTLSFAALVTADPRGSLFSDAANYHTAKWLGTRQPISILPSVANLKALRAVAKPASAPRPFIGFGNPLLDGNPKESFQADLAKRARAQQTCSNVTPGSMVEAARKVVPLFAQSGLAETSLLRAQLPLPETANELCDVAKSFGIKDGELDDAVRLGTRATETEVKALSASSRLAEFRIVHLATHAALGGEVSGTAEPGLILTPPATASGTDDGYLTASEIAHLRVNADWVILSACNTAGAGAKDNDAFSGLARAFFYAGARSLLVSHWAVSSEATVELVRGAFNNLKADPNLGRAAAMQLSMKQLVDGAAAEAAHPTYWAAFVVVGEGAR